MSDLRILAYLDQHPGSTGYDMYLAFDRSMPMQTVFRTLGRLNQSGLIKDGIKVSRRDRPETPFYLTGKGRELLAHTDKDAA